MSAPQYIYLALICLGLGVDLAKHGQPRTGKHNFAMTAVVSGLVVGLLYWGGFFAGSAA